MYFSIRKPCLSGPSFVKCEVDINKNSGKVSSFPTS
ncbi:hypothetical protein BACOVA_05061 [Bacteroides ovatus ATCC 8483]|uniref:Uncharacterized protein n=1 Tax=Bacteroides ovatus (strain ATCC 8483 / DSM 1896 / JCM 5824 / BCRC 10623 / CCUG 4943 / NCTC 11153) TaxID=411476 RepID=A0AAN3A3M5_BACO1|nr:hypothetical protein BACOVA_05061 [Bacteroides ovatus ATCC 8483]